MHNVQTLLCDVATKFHKNNRKISAQVLGCFLTVLLCVMFFSVGRGHAQIITVGDDTSTPIEGAGHNYMKLLSDTVNPANGALSLRITIPTPKGRGISLPFSFSYDTNGVVNLSAPSATPVWYSQPRFLSSGGWTYSLPMLTSSTWTKVLYNGGQEGGTIKVTCQYRGGYIFQDPSGGRHSLYLGTTGYEVVTGGSNGENPPLCSNAFTGDYDPQFWGTFDEPATHTGSLLTPVTVSDNDGTIYYFPIDGNLQLPEYIEDRNGNLINFSNTTDNNTPITVTDSVGRTVLYSSGFASGTTTLSTPDEQYSIIWVANSATYTVPVTKVESNPGGDYGCAPVSTSVPVSGNVISSITLPNQKQYKFYYGTNPNSAYDNPYGLLSEIDYPSGAWVRYTWKLSDTPNEAAIYDASCNPEIAGCRPLPNACQDEYQSPVVATRTVGFGGTSASQTQTFTYNTTWNSSLTPYAWSSKSTSVSTTDDVRGTTALTKYSYAYVLGESAPYSEGFIAQQIPVESSIASYNWGNTTSPIRTVNKTWKNQYLLTSEQTILNDASGLSSQTSYSYNSNYQLTQKNEYDFGATTATRSTITNWQSFNATILHGQIMDKPCQTLVEDGSSNIYAETNYLYDGGTTVCGTPGTPSVSSVSGLVSGTHDETNYGGGSTVARANLTTKTELAGSGPSATTTFTYDETGQVLSATDPCGNTTCSDMTGTNHTTTYTYTDNYTILSSGQNVLYAPTGATNAYLTKMTNALGHISYFAYDYHNGQLTAVNDPNNQTTTYLYNDYFSRPTVVVFPDGGQTGVSYNDAAYNPSTPSPSVTTTRKMTSTTNYVSTIAFDGVGHPTATILTDPEGNISTATTYDGMGMAYKVSNPYRSTGDPTYGVTTNTYDVLGRTTQILDADGSSPVTTTFAASPSATAYCSIVTDEAQKNRSTCTDGLGRMTTVFEAPNNSGFNYETDYQYSPTNNMLQVVQHGGDSNSADWRTRTFTYNLMSKLLTANNPESGLTTYTYDADGNASTKLDARGITSTYTYDVLDRLKQKAYSDGTLPSTYTYDTNPTLTITNGIGRLVQESTTAGVEDDYSYDPVGRVENLWHCIQPQCATEGYFQITGVYDGIGDLTSYTDGVGNTFTQGFDTAGRMTQINSSLVDAQHPSTLISVDPSLGYYPNGSLRKATLGNALTETTAFNNRFQPCQMDINSSGGYYSSCTNAAPTNTILNMTYGFAAGAADNGNLVSFAATGAQTFNRSYTYDPLNRMLTMTAPGDSCSGLSWTYDPWANRTAQTITGGTCYSFQASATTQNQLVGYSYDADGDLLSDGTHSYSYDAENRVVKVDSGVTAAYVYGADGIRAQKVTGAGTVDYIHGLSGQVVAEWGPGNAWGAGYVYFGGELLAEYRSGATFFVHGDQLGSTRLVTSLSGAVSDSMDYLPFGEQIAGDAGTTHKFTGKERDAESGNDNFGARYYSSNMGRFMTPDWAARPTNVPYAVFGDPQSLNLYGYVRNDPVSRADADGHSTYLTMMADSDGGFTNFDWVFQVNLKSLNTSEKDESATATLQNNQKKADQKQAAQQNSSSTATPASQQGHFEYDQKTGKMTHVHPDGSRVVVGTGYSGQGNGLNNPSEQYTPNTGPIPQGTYTIGPQQNNVTGAGHKLSGSMQLTPTSDTDTHGRAGFLIHGDNSRGDHSASNGCIILPRSARNGIGGSNDHTLMVVP